MKKIFGIIRKVCLSIFSIYGFNLLFSSINLVIPINIWTIFVNSFLGIFGLLALLIMKLLL